MCIASEYVQDNCHCMLTAHQEDCILTSYKEECMLAAYTGHDVLFTRIRIDVYTVLARTVSMKSKSNNRKALPAACNLITTPNLAQNHANHWQQQRES